MDYGAKLLVDNSILFAFGQIHVALNSGCACCSKSILTAVILVAVLPRAYAAGNTLLRRVFVITGLIMITTCFRLAPRTLHQRDQYRSVDGLR